MLKKLCLVMAGACLCVHTVRAEERPFSVTADVTWASKYMIDGFDVAGDHPVWQPSLSVTTPLEGLSAMLWSSLQIDRQNQQYDEFDLMARYSHNLFEGTSYALNFHGYFDYWTFPKSKVALTHSDGSISLENTHGNKLHAGVSATNLFPLWGSYLVPTYNAYYLLYWEQNQRDRFEGGARHEISLEYYHWIPRFIPGATYQYAGIAGDVNYNDGTFGVHPGWSHSTAEFATGVYALGCIFSLTLNRQWTFQPSVDPQNEFWSTLSFTKEF